MKHVLLFTIFYSLLFIAGCSGNIRIHGKVSYPDGTPLKKGTVFFQNEQIRAQGGIQKDGTFQVGMLKDGDGVPPGNYAVYIGGASDIIPAPVSDKPNAVVQDDKITLLIDKKFMQPETSGLTCTVAKGMKLQYDITVSK